MCALRLSSSEMPLSNISEFQSAVRQLAASQVPAWTVHVELTGNELPVRVSLSHPLSAGYQWLFTKEHVEAADVSSIAASVETFPELRAPPPPAQNARLVRGITAVAKAFQWPPEQFRALVAELEASDCLTKAEADWLRVVNGD